MDGRLATGGGFASRSVRPERAECHVQTVRRWLAKQGLHLVDGGMVWRHDDDCPRLHGGRCNCRPELTIHGRQIDVPAEVFDVQPKRPAQRRRKTTLLDKDGDFVGSV